MSSESHYLNAEKEEPWWSERSGSKKRSEWWVNPKWGEGWSKAIKQLSYFISSREHNFPYFNIFEIRMYLKIDGMSYFSQQHFFFLSEWYIQQNWIFYWRHLEFNGTQSQVDGWMVCMLSRVQFFASVWTVACQAPLSMEFSRQEHWSGLSFPTSGDPPDSPGYLKQISFCYIGWKDPYPLIYSITVYWASSRRQMLG